MPTESLQEKKQGLRRGVGVTLALCALMALCAGGMYLYTRSQTPPEPVPTATPTAEPTPTPAPPDGDPPIIEGVRDMTVALGMAPSYRSGVTAVDETDGKVKLEVDASAVNLTEPGEYPVIYRAADKSGNQAEATVTVTVVAVPGVDDDDPTADVSGEGQAELPPIGEVTPEMVDEEAGKILAQITSDSMSSYEKARAIFNYVNSHVKYVGTSDKSSWLMGAYVGFTRHRGDCYNYFACSKALLTKAGIPNVDLYRVGGNTDHYWQLVNVGGGWYHFDACPHPNSYPLTCFLLDELAVRSYTQQCTPVRTNYYVYDYENCPVTPVGFPVEELPAEGELPAESPLPGEGEAPDPLGPETGEVLLPPGVLTSDPTQSPAGLPAEPSDPNVQSPAEELPSPSVPPIEESADPGLQSPAPEPTPAIPETQAPEEIVPSPAVPPAVETPAEFSDPSGKEVAP